MTLNEHNLLKKYISFSLGTWFRALISFFITPITTWLINPGEFGKASMFSSVYSIVLLISLLGTPQSFLRFFPQKSEEEKPVLLWSSLVPPVLFSILVSLVVFIFRSPINSFLVGTSESKVHIILIATLITGIFQTFNLNLVKSKGRAILFSAIQMIQSLSQMGFIVLYALLVSRDFYALLYAQLFSNVVALVVGMFFERSYWFPIKMDKKLVFEIIKYGYPFAFSGLLWWFLSWIDRIVLRLYTSFSDIGLYSAAFKIVSAMSLFTTGFSTLWFPIAYEQYEKNPDNKMVFKRIFDYVTFFVFTIGFLLLSLKDFIYLFLAKSYRSAAAISPFLILYPVMTTLITIIGRGIDFSGKTYWLMICNGITAFFNLLGNFLLVPLVGAKGAAMSTGLSFIILFTVESIISKRLYPVPYDLKKVYYLVSLFVLSATLHTFSQNLILPVLSSVFGVFVTIFAYKSEFLKVVSIGIDFLKSILHHN
ncbi:MULTISPECIES: lipopolysaccharide biosynthesis protein [unclassified Thermotoga]|uniref:lipopolysaccharide biosynthesis protein n=1 Tax=unclassified Thermotoga TaxID=2631113 RepID=UPI00041C225E|nr:MULTISPECIES: oligosaccharide flippase family protein [unclassified Thermotoga]AIY87677.1 polysaccharide biosynthesis protein [Thermotoga sp. Cell2]KHC92606.1 polysaccharide biosynthesis protein [Thermotoga sp. TBGT1765]KHC93577.1 polysaccharide biosynthesis protein [Thermotoga sp. TBGT1766]KHC96380.1 polysaccharide biosynthesis protein [Thermotoga sp. Xyl54]